MLSNAIDKGRTRTALFNSPAPSVRSGCIAYTPHNITEQHPENLLEIDYIIGTLVSVGCIGEDAVALQLSWARGACSLWVLVRAAYMFNDLSDHSMSSTMHSHSSLSRPSRGLMPGQAWVDVSITTDNEAPAFHITSRATDSDTSQ